MEYLSNVRICVAKKDMRIIKKALESIKSNLFEICDIRKEFIGNDKLRYVVFGWENIQWYLNYNDIFIIVKLLKEFKAKGIPFKFLRIGQDERDVELDISYDKDYSNDNALILEQMLVKV